MKTQQSFINESSYKKVYLKERFLKESMLPKRGDLVVVQVKEIADLGAYVSLLEYDGKTAMIPMSELSERRSKNRLIYVGKVEVASVLDVDEQKGYVDLSRKNISLENVLDSVSKWRPVSSTYSVKGEVDIAFYRSNGVDVLKEGLLEGLSVDVTKPLEISLSKRGFVVVSEEVELTRKVCGAIVEKVNQLGGHAYCKV